MADQNPFKIILIGGQSQNGDLVAVNFHHSVVKFLSPGKRLRSAPYWRPPLKGKIHIGQEMTEFSRAHEPVMVAYGIHRNS